MIHINLTAKRCKIPSVQLSNDELFDENYDDRTVILANNIRSLSTQIINSKLSDPHLKGISKLSQSRPQGSRSKATID